MMIGIARFLLCKKKMMPFSALNSSALLLLLISTTFFFGLSNSEIMYNQMEEQREFVSGGDDNIIVGAEMSSKILTNFRFLLGLHSSKSSRQKKHSLEGLTPAPSPVDRFHSHHVYYTSYPFTHKSHTPSPRHSNGGRRDESVQIRIIVIAVAVSAGSVFAVIFFVATFLVCKSCRRRRRRRRNHASLNCRNRVSFDPDTGPELFYLNSLAAIADIESSCKLNVLSNESLTSYINASSHDQGIHPTSSSSHSCESEKVLLNEDMSSTSNQLGNGEFVKSSDSSSVTYLDEEILEIEVPTSDDDDDGTFHSVCNSCDSIASELSFSCASGMCSPFNSSNGSISPNMIMLTHSPLFIPPTLMTFMHTSRLNSKTNKPSPKSSATSPPISSIISNSKISRQPPPCIPSHSEKSIPKPPPPPPSPSHSNGSIPQPPPPPLPALRSSPSFQSGSSSRQPPPPPACQFQQSTPIGKDGTPLPKLKPLHWDKVRAGPNRCTVWDRIKSSSFELDEQMMESLFRYNTQSSAKTEEAKAKSSSPGNKHVLDNKRLQNITILLKAVNATSEQVCEALVQGRGLSSQQLEALAKMVPTKEEEEKFFNYSGVTNELDLSEIFVKAILNIPFAFSRIQVMLYKETFEDEVVHLNKSFAMLEDACRELRSSRLFFRLLEAVLKTGNRMNVGTIRGGARAFKLDTLLKLAHVKGTDGKTTLLHFVVQEIIRSEGVTAMEKSMKKNKPKTDEEREEGYRVMGLDIVSGLSTELCNVKKTASIDLDVLASSVANLTEGMNQMKHLVEVDLTNGDGERDKSIVNSMKTFLISAERIIKELKEDENRVLVHVREITEYYHGDVSKDEANPLRIFVIVRDFLTMLDRVCKEVRSFKCSNSAIPFR